MGEPMDRSNYWLNKPVSSFSQAFPAVESAYFEYEELSITGTKKGIFSISGRGGVMPCGNPQCRRGGYELDRILHSMTPNKTTELKVHLHCPGDEGTPKGRKKGDPCDMSVDGVIKVKYRECGPEQSQMRIEKLLNAIREKKLTEPHIVLDTFGALSLLNLEDVLDCLSSGKARPLHVAVLREGGTTVIEHLIRHSRIGDVIRFTIEGETVTVDECKLSPEVEADVRTFAQDNAPRRTKH